MHSRSVEPFVALAAVVVAASLAIGSAFGGEPIGIPLPLGEPIGIPLPLGEPIGIPLPLGEPIGIPLPLSLRIPAEVAEVLLYLAFRAP